MKRNATTLIIGGCFWYCLSEVIYYYVGALIVICLEWTLLVLLIKCVFALMQVEHEENWISPLPNSTLLLSYSFFLLPLSIFIPIPYIHPWFPSFHTLDTYIYLVSYISHTLHYIHPIDQLFPFHFFLYRIVICVLSIHRVLTSSISISL